MRLATIIVLVLAGVAQGQDYVLVDRDTGKAVSLARGSDGALTGDGVTVTRFPLFYRITYADGRTDDFDTDPTRTHLWPVELMTAEEFRGRGTTRTLNWWLWPTATGFVLLAAWKWRAGKRERGV
jgi:hypothetical protein